MGPSQGFSVHVTSRHVPDTCSVAVHFEEDVSRAAAEQSRAAELQQG